jgi:hypothetical protein
VKIALANEPVTFKQVVTLLKMVNRDDEPFLYSLFKDKIFALNSALGYTLTGHDALTLLNFYLGYCTSETRM